MYQLKLNLFDTLPKTEAGQLSLLLPVRPPAAEIIVRAARAIAEHLAQKTVTTRYLSGLLTDIAGGSDAEGAWNWKQAYEAIEIAIALHLRQRGALLCKLSPREVLRELSLLQAKLPTHTKRSENQQELQQFSTPLHLAYLMALASQIQPGETLLEPSAGTGMLAIWGEIMESKLILNEIDPLRSALLRQTFPKAALSQYNGEQINDYLPASAKPQIVLINPPFSKSPQMAGRNAWATYKHLESALSRLQQGGRMVALTANWFSPSNPKWSEAIAKLTQKATLRLSAGIEGREYRKHGTNVETRITVFDKVPNGGVSSVIPETLSTESLLCAIAALPRRDDTSPICIIPKPNNVPVAVKYIASERQSGRESGIYQNYRPQRIEIPGAIAHPTPLVESVAMAAVTPPVPTYQPLLSPDLIEGKLSEAQLEAVIYAGEAHQKMLPGYVEIDERYDLVRTSPLPEPKLISLRRGYFIGDGTGVGKGRECAAIVLDNFNRGRKKAVWLSKSDKLIEDARRDWAALGQNPDSIVSLSKFKQDILLSQGIIFVTYATLRREARLQQLTKWLGTAFDGAILFDEAHALSNAIGEKGSRGNVKPSQQGLAGLKLQRMLPNARITYVSATGASKLSNLSYAERLGLWGTGTQFKDRADFISSVGSGGIAALEVVARDLKAFGLYLARSLSYEGVNYEILTHELNESQREIYDNYATAYQIIHDNIQSALEITNITSPSGKTRNREAKGAIISAFESTKQRFFNHLLQSMKSQTLISAIAKDLEAGHSCIVQLISTDEALLDRALSQIPTDQWQDLQIDITPREYVFDYLKNAFPVYLHEVWKDDKGNEFSKIATDPAGNPIFSQAALAQRQQLLEDLALLPPLPSALDQIIQHFGTDIVAECTGRTKRVVRQGDKLLVQKRSSNAAIADTNAFQSGEKRILIFSQAGGTGRSYHADLNCQNKALRRHYLMDLGFSSAEAVQGLGRSHRSNQAQPPVFILVTSDIKAEKRFTSTIAKRLDALGALTRGQRQTGSQNLFDERDNLESEYAKAALKQFYYRIYSGSIPGLSLARFTQVTALKLTKEEGGFKEELPPMHQFLNRCLAMPVAEGRNAFSHLEEMINANIEDAIADGSYEVGVETLVGDFKVIERQTILEHSNGSLTEAIKIEEKKIRIKTSAIAALARNLGKPCINRRSNRAAIASSSTRFVGVSGELVPCYVLHRPEKDEKLTVVEFEKSCWEFGDRAEFASVWDREVDLLPEFTTRAFYLIVGLLLPIWKRLNPESMKVYRLCMGKEQLLGRVVDVESMSYLADKLQISASSLTPEEIWESARSKPVKLGENFTLRPVSVMGSPRLEITGWSDKGDLQLIKDCGGFTEIDRSKIRAFIPNNREGIHAISKILASFR